jgi:hypothetical protein
MNQAMHRKTLPALIAAASASIVLSGCAPVSDAAEAVEKASSRAFEDVTCDQLAQESVEAAKTQDVQLLKVRNPKIVKDNRKTYEKPAGDDDALVLSCKGTGVWSDGEANGPVLLKLTVDADGDDFIAWEPL